MAQAADILKGRKVAEGTRLLVTPASQQIAMEAMKTGAMEILMEAGAMIPDLQLRVLRGERPRSDRPGGCCLSTTNRNFKGRMPEFPEYTGFFTGTAGHLWDIKIKSPEKFEKSNKTSDFMARPKGLEFAGQLFNNFL